MNSISLPIVEPNSAPKPAPTVDGEVRGKYAFVSLGCPKNLVDSERMLGLLRDDGFQLVQEPENSDFVVINTCGFIDNARRESLEAIDQMLELKRDGKIKGLIVSGCLAERERDHLLEIRPEIDSLVGVFSRDDITQMAGRLVDGLDEQRTVFKPAPIRALDDSNRLRITPQHFAFLKVSEGCDRLCTFCAIPKMRGKHASKPHDAVIAEAKQLAASGARELIVVAQDTTYYGRDIYGESRLNELLLDLEKVDGIDWIRLMYFYPMYITDELIDTIATSEKIVPYIDMPLQHASASMLKRMARRVTPAGTQEIVDKLRDRIDNLVLRTTFITGFPGETDQDFEEMVDFVQRVKFERLGVFTYSFEPDTPAAKLKDHLEDSVKLERQQRLMEVQQEIAFAWARRQIGTGIEVIIDKAVDEEKNVWVGRSFADAPDVDALVYVTGQPNTPIRSGEIVPVEVVGTQDYDLVAAAIGPGR